MLRFFLVWNVLVSAIIIAFWLLALRFGLDPVILVAALAGLTTIVVGVLHEPRDWSAIVVGILVIVMGYLIAVYFPRILGESISAPHFFICLNLFISSPAMVERYLNDDEEATALQRFVCLPALFAFVWTIEVGLWWGLGTAGVLFFLQLVVVVFMDLDRRARVEADSWPRTD